MYIRTKLYRQYTEQKRSVDNKMGFEIKEKFQMHSNVDQRVIIVAFFGTL